MRAMGKVVERRKKKGRPSLLDLQKRILKQQKQEQEEPRGIQNHHHKRNSISNYRSFPVTPIPTRKSTRRISNPASSYLSDFQQSISENEDDELAGNRREKKFKLVLRLPSQYSDSQNSASCASESNPEDESASANPKKWRINTTVSGSGQEGDPIACKTIQGSQRGTQLDSGPSTPLPDKNLLLFILDRLQKKDTYGVFSEPVDPNELPDYHDIIQHPMDFGTVRSKLERGAYANLEQFEKDVFLISSNAMQYNAPDTVYFRQARSIYELARKSFENLRQDSGEDEHGSKLIRRGRPATKNLKKPMVEVSANATLASNGEKSGHDMRRGHFPNKNGIVNSVIQRIQASHNNESCSRWMSEQKLDKCAMCRSNLTKQGKKHAAFDEVRRDTYREYGASCSGCEPPLLAPFDGERKELVPVGLHWEMSYARSLASFAALLGPIAWKIASRKIAKSLPSGTPFGPGWVGENEPVIPRLLPVSPSVDRPSTSAVCRHDSSSNICDDRVGTNTTNPHPGVALPAQMGSLPSEPCSPGCGRAELESQNSRPPVPECSSQISSAMQVSADIEGQKYPPPLPDSVPPDLNVVFHLQASPPSSGQADGKQPDLALQL